MRPHKILCSPSFFPVYWNKLAIAVGIHYGLTWAEALTPVRIKSCPSSRGSAYTARHGQLLKYGARPCGIISTCLTDVPQVTLKDSLRACRTGPLMKFPAQHCFSPANPDVTGIGVRISLYVQSFFIAFFDLIICRVLKKAYHQPNSDLGHLQIYTVIGIILAALIQISKGNLSLFHQHAAVHLALLSWNSGFLAALSSLRQSDINLRQAIYRLVSFSAVFQTVLIILTGLDMAMKHCQAPESAEPIVTVELTWVFFGGHLRGDSVSYGILFALLAMPTLWFLRISLAFTGHTTCASYVPRPALVFAVVWLEEIISIEMSLRANPLLDFEAEDSWGFGQILPLVLLLPFGERLWEVLIRREAKEKAAGSGSQDTSVTSNSYTLCEDFTSIRFHHSLTSLDRSTARSCERYTRAAPEVVVEANVAEPPVVYGSSVSALRNSWRSLATVASSRPTNAFAHISEV